MHEGRLVETGERFDVEADMVLTAIGQSFVPPLGVSLALQGGRIATDDEGPTSHWRRSGPAATAGMAGRDLTVEAVEHGKVAAIAIDRVLARLEGV
jgi:dihydropyrimidine dehydrogenase (NAD+) subunit PreT